MSQSCVNFFFLRGGREKKKKIKSQKLSHAKVSREIYEAILF